MICQRKSMWGSKSSLFKSHSAHTGCLNAAHEDVDTSIKSSKCFFFPLPQLLISLSYFILHCPVLLKWGREAVRFITKAAQGDESGRLTFTTTARKPTKPWLLTVCVCDIDAHMPPSFCSLASSFSSALSLSMTTTYKSQRIIIIKVMFLQVACCFLLPLSLTVLHSQLFFTLSLPLCLPPCLTHSCLQSRTLPFGESDTSRYGTSYRVQNWDRATYLLYPNNIHEYFKQSCKTFREETDVNINTVWDGELLITLHTFNMINRKLKLT